jgi:hypothetical protein
VQMCSDVLHMLACIFILLVFLGCAALAWIVL